MRNSTQRSVEKSSPFSIKQGKTSGTGTHKKGQCYTPGRASMSLSKIHDNSSLSLKKASFLLIVSKNLGTQGSHSAVKKQTSSNENTAEMQQPPKETKRFQARCWPCQTSELSRKHSCNFITFFSPSLVAADSSLAQMKNSIPRWN